MVKEKNRKVANMKEEGKVNYYKGQILVSEWGYGQTNQTFYKVIKLSKSGKSITIREIQKTYKANKDNYMCGYEKPLASLAYVKGSKPITKRVNILRNYIRPEEYMGSLKVWDGKPKFSSSWN